MIIRLTRSLTVITSIFIFLIVTIAFADTKSAPIHISVDASQATQRILHAHLVIPAAPGPLTLYYPKWVPGDHSPTGLITDLAGLRFHAGKATIPWTRDDVDMYAFHLNVPEGVDQVEGDLDFVIPADSNYWTYATAKRFNLCWWSVLLYPAGFNSDALTFSAHLRLPAGWKFGTALPVANQSGDEIEFTPVSLTTLFDSPLIASPYFKQIQLTSGNQAPVEVDIVSEQESSVQAPDDWISNCKKLVLEAEALFNAHHYRSYRFLLTLSDTGLHDSQEHHESSDDRTWEKLFTDQNVRNRYSGTLAHEYVHSWNGKYRRPAGLATPDYQQPMKGELLWIYEGMTRYLDAVLSARSGFRDMDLSRENLARIVDEMQNHRGRDWRPLEDTAISAQLLYSASGQWENWRRGTDFYDEGALTWLEVDLLLRQKSGGHVSLDDFCRAFFGPPTSPPEVKPYQLEDVVSALNHLASYDWQSFFASRLNGTSTKTPIDSLAQSGWRLVYNSTENIMRKSRDEVGHTIDLTSSIGLYLRDDGEILDVVSDSAAFRAGIAPGMKLLAVNERQWTPERLRTAIGKATVDAPIQLLAESADYYKTYTLDYHEGERYPHLERDPSKPDLLSQIFKSRTDH